MASSDVEIAVTDVVKNPQDEQPSETKNSSEKQSLAVLVFTIAITYFDVATDVFFITSAWNSQQAIAYSALAFTCLSCAVGAGIFFTERLRKDNDSVVSRFPSRRIRLWIWEGMPGNALLAPLMLVVYLVVWTTELVLFASNHRVWLLLTKEEDRNKRASLFVRVPQLIMEDLPQIIISGIFISKQGTSIAAIANLSVSSYMIATEIVVMIFVSQNDSDKEGTNVGQKFWKKGFPLVIIAALSYSGTIAGTVFTIRFWDSAHFSDYSKACLTFTIASFILVSLYLSFAWAYYKREGAKPRRDRDEDPEVVLSVFCSFLSHLALMIIAAIFLSREGHQENVAIALVSFSCFSIVMALFMLMYLFMYVYI